jgi:hypothetical protein
LEEKRRAKEQHAFGGNLTQVIDGLRDQVPIRRIDVSAENIDRQIISLHYVFVKKITQKLLIALSDNNKHFLRGIQKLHIGSLYHLYEHNYSVRGHCMCKELPVIPVNKVVDPKKNNKKMEGRGGGEAQGVADTKKTYYFLLALKIHLSTHFYIYLCP